MWILTFHGKCEVVVVVVVVAVVVVVMVMIAKDDRMEGTGWE